jgi:hypothetical protein
MNMEVIKEIPPEMIAAAQAQLDSLPSYAAEYVARLASFSWQPIAAYDKAAALTVLFRHSHNVCAGSWAAATIWTKPAAWSKGSDLDATWRSAEEATLEMPLQFEPEEFAVLDDETLHGFIAT